MAEKFLPLAAMEKLLKLGGAKRVGEDAKDALKYILEQKSSEIAKKAMVYAQHAKRKTVKAEDIRLALSQ